MNEMLDRIRKYTADELGVSGSHGMDHTLRVFSLCRIIGNGEGADMRILLPAALLHDIARPLEKERGVPHEEEGARIAVRYLTSIGYDPELIGPVASAILTHRFTTKVKPKTLEARVLSDADKLDAMGAVGIARTFLRAGEHAGGIDDAVAHFHEKLLKLPDHMYTGTGRKIAAERKLFLVKFLETLERERETGGT